ncbi:hypothetical protein MHI48_19645 [Paenibacillus sp. FSL H7-0942]|uniref:Uncharacterized protein n=1 Tax=Paenibacillus amylolyticus TaxID=1451 RepID=A0A1R1E0X9_PAEAM|nr:MULTISPECIES: hypothetical protein [Paenibacillus]ETT33360.1 hypothetical protein C161_20117 [Paenibacillus sp. FSL R5-192]ETT53362.1 hypothetical protein C170_07324 [Paenibacillus sp. FSL H7-689]MBT2283763.1 hypothetical protein [Paenibacillus polymyxa]MCF7753435.1 hypothetical protein [Paenibacillus xylanexedens]MDQ0655332.1 hypothetical protein [Paenibacillus sp. W2I17]
MNKAILFLAVIETMLEALHHTEVDQTELVDSLVMLGFDPIEMLYETNTIRSFQKICRAFAELHLTDEALDTFSKE